MKRSPKDIDFQKLTTRLQSQIDALKLYVKRLQEEDEQNPETKIAIPELLNEIDVKEDLLKEYKTFVKQGNKQYEKEIADYKENFKTILKQAKSFKRDYSIPKQLRDHLKEVLMTNFKALKGLNEKVTYFLALKKEVKMCVNYKMRK